MTNEKDKESLESIKQERDDWKARAILAGKEASRALLSVETYHRGKYLDEQEGKAMLRRAEISLRKAIAATQKPA